METIKQQPTTRVFQVGNTVIQVQNEQFQYGYQQGYERFYERYAHIPLTDLEVYRFVLRNVLDTFTSELARAGYIIGWLAALIEHRQTGTEREGITIAE